MGNFERGGGAGRFRDTSWQKELKKLRKECTMKRERARADKKKDGEKDS